MEAADLGGHEADGARRRRLQVVGEGSVPPASSLAATGTRGEDKRHHEKARGEGEEEEERERGGHRNALHAHGEDARPGTHAVCGAAAALNSGLLLPVGRHRRGGGRGRGPTGVGGSHSRRRSLAWIFLTFKKKINSRCI